MKPLLRLTGTSLLAASILLSPLAGNLAASVQAQTAPSAAYPFKDIEKSPSLGHILLLFERGVVQGYGDGQFKPDQTISRAEFIKLLATACGLTPKYVAEHAGEVNFRDVQGWSRDYVALAVNQGWMSGYGNGEFRPNAPIRYSEALAAILRSMGLTNSAQTKPWFEGYLAINREFDLDLLSDQMAPDRLATRGLIAEMIVRFLMNMPYDPSIGMFNVQSPASNTSYAMEIQVGRLKRIVAQTAAASAYLELADGQRYPMQQNGRIYGRLVAGNEVWYTADQSGSIAFVYGESLYQDTLGLARPDAAFDKLFAVYRTLKSQYVTELSDPELVNGAIDGMLKAIGDPYTSYMSPEEAAKFFESIESAFEGIGAEIRAENGEIVIARPIAGSPAEKAGLLPNDVILRVDDIDVKGMTVEEVVTFVRGPKGSSVKLLIRRGGEQMTVSVVRDTVTQKTVQSSMLENGAGYVQITKFAEPTTDEFQASLASLKSQGMSGLIVDLRQNPGGLLYAALEIANQLVPSGNVLFQVEYKDGSKEVYESSNGLSADDQLPLIVLVDEGSASAAEVLAAALKESGGAQLVGVKTFGKGTVQSSDVYLDGSNIKLTTAKWLTPSGHWVHGNGLQPDMEVSLPAYASLAYVDPDKSFSVGTANAEVSTIQQMLAALGFEPGRTDGMFDDQTKRAVAAFQAKHGLEATGTVTGSTTVKLMEKLIELIRANDTQLEAAKKALNRG